MGGPSERTIVPLAESQIPQAAGVLARAFQNDSLASYMLPHPAERARLLPFHFEVLLRYGLLAEKVWTTKGVEGVVVCQPPGHMRLDEGSLDRAGIADERRLLGKDALDRFERFGNFLDSFRYRDAGASHWFVLVIGVDPAKKGAGVGSVLLRQVSAQADLDQLPVYLETEQSENVPFYEKNGFRLLVQGSDPRSRLRFWTFKRQVNTQ